MIMRFICWLTGRHFVFRTTDIVMTPKLSWRTRLRCRCGLVDYYRDGLVEHP